MKIYLTHYNDLNILKIGLTSSKQWVWTYTTGLDEPASGGNPGRIYPRWCSGEPNNFGASGNLMVEWAACMW